MIEQATKEEIAKWDAILEKHGLGVYVGSSGSLIEHFPDYHNSSLNVEPFDYTLKHKRADGRTHAGKLRIGQRGPFTGGHHTEEEKRLISEEAKRQWKVRKAKKVQVFPPPVYYKVGIGQVYP